MSSFLDRIREPFRQIVEAVRQVFGGGREHRDAVVFSAAIIALSAKMAKADGTVTPEEVAAFRRICEVPPGEAGRVRRLFDLAKSTVLGFDGYARQIAEIYDDRPETLIEVLDALFAIAKADGVVHERELVYLAAVAEIFGLDQAEFRRLKARHLCCDGFDPYAALDIAEGASNEEIKRRYRTLVLENHPDRLVSRGLPAEYLKLANERLAAINAAYDTIRRARAL